MLPSEGLLGLSKEQFNQHITHLGIKPHDKVLTGAAIFKTCDSSPAQRKLLLVKRAPEETYYPNMLELPSGKMDDNDVSLLAGLAREVFEETGLQIDDES